VKEKGLGKPEREEGQEVYGDRGTMAGVFSL